MISTLILFYLGISLVFGLIATQLIIREKLKKKRDAEQYTLFLESRDEIGALCLAIRYNLISIEDLWSSDDRMPKSIPNANTKDNPVVVGLQIIGTSLVWPSLIIGGLIYSLLHWKREHALQTKGF